MNALAPMCITTEIRLGETRDGSPALWLLLFGEANEPIGTLALDSPEEVKNFTDAIMGAAKIAFPGAVPISPPRPKP